MPTSATACSTSSRTDTIRPMRSPHRAISAWCSTANMIAPATATTPTEIGDTGDTPTAVITASTATACTTAMPTAGARERSATCHIGRARSSRRPDSAGSSRNVANAPIHSARAATKGKVAVEAPAASFCRSATEVMGSAPISAIRSRSDSE